MQCDAVRAEGETREPGTRHQACEREPTLGAALRSVSQLPCRRLMKQEEPAPVALPESAPLHLVRKRENRAE